MRSPILWFGGKGNMVKKLLDILPPHREYIEPFFGGGSLFFAKYPAKVETINDLNHDLMNFYRVLRDSPDEFIRLANLTPYSRELYYECRETYQTEPDQIKRAWRFWVVAKMSFSGLFGESWSMAIANSTRGMAGTTSKFLSTIDTLPEVSARLNMAQIECNPAIKVIRQYATPTSLIYADPPYVTSTRQKGGYTHEMTDADHEELITALVEAPGSVIVSGYDHPIYRRLEASGFDRVDFQTACHAAAKTRTSKLQGTGAAIAHAPRTETVWVKATKQERLF